MKLEFSRQIFEKKILILVRIEWNLNFLDRFSKKFLFLSEFNETLIFSTDFRKKFLFLSEFNETLIFSTDFRKNSQISNFMKIRPVGAEVFYAEAETDGQMDGQTWRS